jgi:hypothetical protein
VVRAGKKRGGGAQGKWWTQHPHVISRLATQRSASKQISSLNKLSAVAPTASEPRPDQINIAAKMSSSRWLPNSFPANLRVDGDCIVAMTDVEQSTGQRVESSRKTLLFSASHGSNPRSFVSWLAFSGDGTELVVLASCSLGGCLVVRP